MRDSETNTITPPIELKGVSQAINRAREVVDRPGTAGSSFQEENAQGLPVLHTITQANLETAKEESDKNRRVLENLQRLENYVPNATRIERERARLKDRATKTREATELLGSGQEKANTANGELENFERNNLPQELIRGEILVSNVNPETNLPRTDFTEVETNYRDNVDQWLEMAREKQAEAMTQIKEENKTPEQKDLETRLAAEKARADAAEERVNQIRNEADAALQKAAEEKAELQRQLNEANDKAAATEATNAVAIDQIKQLAGEAYDEMVEQYEQRLAQAAQEAREREEAIQTAQERRTGRALWWASALAGGAVGATAELMGQGWWLNPILRGATTVGGLGFFAADMGAAVIERRRGSELEDRLGMFRNVARTARTVLSGFGAGIAAVSLSTMAIHAVSEGLMHGAATVAATAGANVTEVGKKVTETLPQSADWLKINVPDHGSAWGTVHNLLNNRAVPGIELWQTPAGNNSADVIAQWSTEIFPHLNNSPVDMIHPGILDLGKHLNPDQVGFLKKLAETKDYDHYLSLVKEFATTHPDIAKVPEVAKVLARK